MAQLAMKTICDIRDLCVEHKLDVAQVCMAWVVGKQAVSSTLVSTSSAVRACPIHIHVSAHSPPPAPNIPFKLLWHFVLLFRNMSRPWPRLRAQKCTLLSWTGWLPFRLHSRLRLGLTTQVWQVHFDRLRPNFNLQVFFCLSEKINFCHKGHACVDGCHHAHRDESPTKL